LKWPVTFESTYAHSKAFAFVLDQYNDFIKSGFADNELAFGNSNMVVYVMENDKIIGASVWSYDKQKRSAWILFSAVLPSYRGKGVYKALNAEIERRAKNLGAVALYSGMHVENEPMITAAVKAGRQDNWYRTKKELQ
jgi:RimJ/RimL family protein N-acetyltransferase